MDNVFRIPSEITKGEELVILPRSLYEKFFVWLNKNSQAKQYKEIEEIISSGDEELRKGQTIIADSSKDALKLYGRKSK